MSAFIVHEQHIAAILGSLMHYHRTRGGIDVARGGHWPQATEIARKVLREPLPEEVVAIGLALENARSVNCRYAHRDPDDLNLHPPTAPTSGMIWEWARRPLSPVELIKAIQCYEYQSDQCDDWERTPARMFCREAMAAAICALDGYDRAPWGIDDSAQTFKRAA